MYDRGKTMNRGFTLVELLIVIVLIGVLTLIALPKYQTSVERARALEAMENICYIAEYIYTHREIDSGFSFNLSDMPDGIKSKYFTISSDGSTATRNGSDWNYSITATGCQDGTGSTDCARLDLPSMHCGD